MAIKDVQTYIDKHGLVETTDSEVDLAADAVIDSVRRLRSHRH